MGLSKCKLGNFIELREVKNTALSFGIDDVRGVNNLKQLMTTKADLNGRDLSKFQIVYPGEFVFNHRTSRNGSKFSIAYNDGDKPVICTEDYVVFRIKESAKQLFNEEWLYMYFNRSEFDRYVITNSWGSSTEFYNWEDICAVELVIPPFRTQQKYVDIYNAMVANQQSYERGLEDLKLTFDALIDEVKHKTPFKSVGDLLKEVDNRNENGQITEVQGINITKQFMPSVADINGVDLKKYKLVKKNQFAFSGMQTGRDECIRIALHKDDKPIIISPAYTVFECRDETILEEYIMMWFSRKESDRHGWFVSDSSIRSNLDLDRFYETQLPVPDEKTQQAIVDIFNVYITRRKINEQLKAQIKNICPILIRGSLEDGK
ncbi:MAG: restriction endonuclease subunit S [Acutalibacteraceae bacterium]